MSTLASVRASLDLAQPMRVTGVVCGVRGLVVSVDDLPLPVGTRVSIGACGGGSHSCSEGEVIGFSGAQAVVMLLGQSVGIRAGDTVVGERVAQTALSGTGLLGRCVDGLCRPIDGKGALGDVVERPLHPPPIPSLRRRAIVEPMRTGVRAIDLMMPIGKGQRVGIFAGPGVGKSTLLGQIARRSAADVNVIALVGERGREVGEFIEHSLGEEGLRRSIVVVSTGDESPLMRVRAALSACAAAEHFRDQGCDVLLMMDSITRFAQALRLIGLSLGEPPATRGYTPSVFAGLSRMLERAGAVEGERWPRVQVEPSQSESMGSVTVPSSHSVAPSRTGGSITGLYTILVEGDDMTEPVADAVRGILDGHVMLSRTLAHRAHFPAIDVLDSISRVADAVSDAAHCEARRQIVRLMAAYRSVEELVRIGAYARGSSVESDVAIEMQSRVEELLRQRPDETSDFAPDREALVKLALDAGEMTLAWRRERKAA